MDKKSSRSRSRLQSKTRAVSISED
jgi:serine/threonine protein kinase